MGLLAGPLCYGAAWDRGHDEARNLRNCGHLRAGEAARDARSRDRRRDHSILEVGQRSPILVRRDGARLVLVEGLHRLEACKALGETTIAGYLVQARKF